MVAGDRTLLFYEGADGSFDDLRHNVLLLAEMPSHSWAGIRAAAASRPAIWIATKPVTIKRSQLAVTADLGKSGWLRAQVIGHGPMSATLRGGGSRVSAVVRWPAGGGLAGLNGTEAALSFTIGGGATLFAFEV